MQLIKSTLALTPLIWSALALASPSVGSQQAPETQTLFYADLADLANRSPVIAIATIGKTEWLHKELAVNVPPGHARLLVTAMVDTLLRGDHGLPPRITYLFDVPLTAANRPPKLRKQKFLIAASEVPGKPDMLQLVSAQAQMAWSESNEALARKIISDLVRPDAAPTIIGIGNAFHVPGSLPGESETQIFLKTKDERPVSLSILRRPGEDPRWSVALGEMVDESAPSPAPDTLLWYRLACFLPDSLPAQSVTDMSPDDAIATNADYRFVMEQLGACKRAPH